MVYGKFILRIENSEDIYLFSTEEELIENTNLILAEFEIKQTAKDLNELKSILNKECDGVHLYYKIAG